MTAPKLTPAEAASQALSKAEAALTLHQETNEMVRENNAMVKEIHDAWMKPHAVYGDKSLLQVLSTLAARASAGEIVGERIVWYATVAGALAALGGLLWWGSKP